MERVAQFFSTPFGSAIVGGLVVAIAGLILLETGVIGDDDDSPGIASTPLAKPASGSSAKGVTVNQIYDRYAKGVAFVQAEVTRQAQGPLDLFPGEQRGTASGSGFLIDDDGHLITNAHVVHRAEEVEVQLGDDEEGQSAEVVGTDPSSDLALLKVDDIKGATPLPLGDSSEAEVGDPVVAIGNPFGLDRTVTTGIVSALQRQIRAPNGFSISDVIQTDAAINPGNSGGPLLDSSGRVIGINSQIATQSGGSEGVGFAVPIATAEDVVSQLREGGSVKRAYLGVTGGDISSEVAGALNLPVQKGVVIEQVFDGGPADSAGIEGATGQATIGDRTFPVGGDIIVEVEGKEIAGMEDVIAAVDRLNPGDELKLTVLRGGEEREVTVQLGERPANVQDASSDSSD